MTSNANTGIIPRNVSENDKNSIELTLRDLKESIDFSYQHEIILIEKKQLELNIKKLSNEISIETKTEDDWKSELDLIKKTTADKEAKLKDVNAKYEEITKTDKDLTRKLALIEQKYHDLYSKLRRGNYFASENERNLEIHMRLNYLFNQITNKKYNRNNVVKILQKEKLNIIEMGNEINNGTTEMEKQRNAMIYQDKLYFQLIQRRNQYQSARNELCLKETIAEQKLYSLKDDLLKIKQDIRYIVNPAIIKGIESVRKVLDTFRQLKGLNLDIVNGYYGLVIENLSCDKDFYTAVEKTAGERLFYHIVETDKIGTKILEEIKRQKLRGEFSFMPLKRLHKKTLRYPTHVNTIPLLTKIQFDTKFERVMKYIFGNMIICQNLDIAFTFSRLTQFDYMILEGDHLSDGTITGGYFTNQSVIELYNNRIKITKQIREHEQKLVAMQREIEIKERQILGLSEEMQKSENRHTTAKLSFDKIYGKIQLTKKKLNMVEQSRIANNKYLVQYDLDLEILEASKDNLETEVQQKLLPDLTTSDQNEMINLYKDMQKLTLENKKISDIRITYELEKNALENSITNYLHRREDEIKYNLENSVLKTLNRELEQNKKDAELANKTAMNLDKTILDMLKKIEERNQNETEATDLVIDLSKDEPPAKKLKPC